MANYNGSQIRAKMIGAKLQTHQKNASIPMINRYIKMLEEGKTPPNIKVANGVIIEGNHRFIAGYVFGRIPKSDPYVDPNPQAKVYSFSEIHYDAADWDAGKTK